MEFNIIIIFIFSLAGGLSVFFFKTMSSNFFKSILSFSAAYLFSITVIHILPELFYQNETPFLAGIFVLLGFLFQVFLNFFSKGIEHGHLPTVKHNHVDGHNHGTTSLTLFVSLLIHSLLEGTLLVHPHALHDKAEVGNILIGLISHKIPESVALGTILITQVSERWLALLLILIYSLASPIGLYLGNVVIIDTLVSVSWFDYLFAFIAGNFFHISTTIFFENESPDHGAKGSKLMVMLLASVVAILVELL
jgi:zinc transporter ZupT